MNTEKFVNLEEEVDYLYEMKDIARIENGKDIDDSELDQIILDAM